MDGRTPEHVYIGFGSNLGDRHHHLQLALVKLRESGLIILRQSLLYETEPWGGAEGGEYLNAVLELPRTGDAHSLLDLLQSVERSLGRVNVKHNSARTCDLDLLLWNGRQIASGRLTVPHPRLIERRFVLRPLCDLIADRVHPVNGGQFGELLRTCQDPCSVRPWSTAGVQ